MKKLTIEPASPPAASEPCNGDLSAQFHRALSVLAGKWKGDILWQLVDRKRRFGELRQSIPGVTQHMLTTQLRDLEANGLVKRTVYPEVPPRVEYEMTPSARALKPVFDELYRWAQEHGFPTSAQGAAGKGGQPKPQSSDGGPEDQPRKADRRSQAR
ncbi:winged helix-turn-helix transcriptional regulator [Bradyrhizobium septentrionale]|uniref:Helix-turn-helix domain-containing protein n=1 Tax=Bradyrhizobium septentrionale TaxID=1404411 RepID=A0A973VUM1_9BRAD|nr:helix-turn-helix domain-containing protein [Bradyrhizobium septentrionale]UGY19449.1 helix-turn-helix transcriptional regulator [Bradyrhizobium septentrionale]UGY28218.1 helix-turn-helix transcriptional regulator [Bradyrhizobium septentrionale]